MDLSVIIPIYKTEAYIKECLNSILSQATKYVEIILVDDGSPDNCPQICDEFAKSDERIRVVHKENGGLSSARNAGMSVACGKYVTFVDSDDVICPGSISKILEWIQNEDADICFLRAEKIYPDGSTQDLGECLVGENLRGQSHEDAIKYLASRPKYPGSAWTKLYKRQFLLDNDLHFPYDRRYSEDLGFVRDCILCAERFDALDFMFYQYRQGRQGSITNKVNAKNFNDLFIFVEETTQKLNVRNTNDPVAKRFMRFVAYEYLILLYLYTRIPQEDKKDALFKLKQFAWTLKYATSKKEKIAWMMCKFCGVRLTAFILKQYRRVVEK